MSSYRDQYPLHQAAAVGDVTRIRELLEHGEKVNARTPYNVTPLMAAVVNRQFETVQALLRKKANVNAKDRARCSALFRATEVGHYRICKALLDSGADVDSVGESFYTPLVNACHAGNLDLVRLLLDHGANANGLDPRKATPLTAVILVSSYAIINKQHRPQEPLLQIIRELLKRGADPNLVGGQGTPLHGAWSVEVGVILLEAGANVNSRNYLGETPLIEIARAGPLDLLRVYIKAGADVNLRSDEGVSAMERIIDRHPPEMETIRMFVDAGADINAVNKWGFSLLDSYQWHYQDRAGDKERTPMADELGMDYYLEEQAAYIEYIKAKGAKSERGRQKVEKAVKKALREGRQ